MAIFPLMTKNAPDGQVNSWVISSNSAGHTLITRLNGDGLPVDFRTSDGGLELLNELGVEFAKAWGSLYIPAEFYKRDSKSLAGWLSGHKCRSFREIAETINGKGCVKRTRVVDAVYRWIHSPWAESYLNGYLTVRNMTLGPEAVAWDEKHAPKPAKE